MQKGRAHPCPAPMASLRYYCETVVLARPPVEACCWLSWRVVWASAAFALACALRDIFPAPVWIERFTLAALLVTSAVFTSPLADTPGETLAPAFAWALLFIIAAALPPALLAV